MIRAAFLTSQSLEAVSGNNTTLRRLARSLAARGIAAAPFSLAATTGEGLLEEMDRFGPDIIHSFHACKAGPAARALARQLRIPFVVMATGTDLNVEFFDPALREILIPVLREAGAVLLGDWEGMGERLLEIRVPRERIRVVPKGVELPDRSLLAPASGGPSEENVLFLLPAGWREVKNNLFPLEPLAAVRRQEPGLRLRFLGPVLDAAYRAAMDADRFPFAEDGGTVPAGDMGREYLRAGVVLNVSHAEGVANAVLEAMAWGRPVLAADIPANRAIIAWDERAPERSTGVLYNTVPSGTPWRRVHDAEDFAAKALRLLRDRDLRAALGRRARAAVERDHTPEREAEAVLAAYRACAITV